MPVNTPNPQYTQRLDEWMDCRDAADGSRAVKLRGERHLPKLGGQTDDEYKAYKQRALWYGATGRTIQGLIGSVFRKAMQVEAPEAMVPQLDDVTLTGISLETFCKAALAEVLKVGRYGILIDMGTEAGATERPYWIGYQAERIINWATTQQHGDTVLTMVVLSEEDVQPDPNDPFVHIKTAQYRVLRMNAGKYVVDIWRASTEDKGRWKIHESITPVFRGAPIPYIPFCFVGPTALTPDPEKPPLLDLVDVNLSHYRSSGDLEHGRHFTALPTPWVAGFPTETVLRIGAAIAWVASDPNARVGMLEFTGQGLGALVTACEGKESLMAILGARMLEEQKKAVESADTHAMRNAGEASALQSIAGTVEQSLTMALRWHVAWLGLSLDKVGIELNKIFVEAHMSAPELAELVRTWQAGAISDQTLYYNMRRGELTRPDSTFEEEQRLISLQAPARLPLQDSLPGVPLS